MNRPVSPISTHPLSALLIGATVALAGCKTPPPRVVVPPPSYASYSQNAQCSYVGRCVDVDIGGVPVVVIADQADQKRVSAAVRAAIPAADRDVYWRLEQPVDGEQALNIHARMNALGERFLGADNGDFKTAIFPLDDQDLESRAELAASRNVRVNGQAKVTQQNTLTSRKLPPGRYVFTIRYYGSKNWDLKAIYLTVK